ncbi:HbrB-domain-containing protein [Saitoella complicata NRRL Y-17804]|uniref:HbrB-domain-containing protein n=1 Tax=Saitoella complicata (strain BCRC 22490 / CBS 7301 / JCM 7358 / NBRC 10748 / NRRL Y-17804) TaxID=698492 RepID=UPI000866E9FF|nr:HbrB-domain-containing protein [Saitoella complicata NRRL Y-17804]ODQ56557.1 HbrB-domain-containing protein [Saitoella complicata NRRL Y-17804]
MMRSASRTTSAPADMPGSELLPEVAEQEFGEMSDSSVSSNDSFGQTTERIRDVTTTPQVAPQSANTPTTTPTAARTTPSGGNGHSRDRHPPHYGSRGDQQKPTAPPLFNLSAADSEAYRKRSSSVTGVPGYFTSTPSTTASRLPQSPPITLPPILPTLENRSSPTKSASTKQKLFSRPSKIVTNAAHGLAHTMSQAKSPTSPIFSRGGSSGGGHGGGHSHSLGPLHIHHLHRHDSDASTAHTPEYGPPGSLYASTVNTPSPGAAPSPPILPLAPTAPPQKSRNPLLRTRKDSNPSLLSSAHSIISSHRPSLDLLGRPSLDTLGGGGALPNSPSSSMFGPLQLQKSISTLDIRSASAHATSSTYDSWLTSDVWPLLSARVLPLFSGEGLRVPVEDLNKLMISHIRRCVGDNTTYTLLDDLHDLLEVGMTSLNQPPLTSSSLPPERLIPRLVEVWEFFFGRVLPYLEAVFLPLQKEWKGVGSVLSERGSEMVWGAERGEIDIRRIALMEFRDVVILPNQKVFERLHGVFSSLRLDIDSAQNITDTASRLLQCVSVLASILSGDEKQAGMDKRAFSFSSSTPFLGSILMVRCSCQNAKR